MIIGNEVIMSYNIQFHLHISNIGVIIPVGALIPIRDTRMIPEIIKTKIIMRNRRKDACF